MALETHQAGNASATTAQSLADEDRSKDHFFHEVAKISESMIAAHGPEFAMGVLVLGARFIAEKKKFFASPDASTCCGGGCHDHTHHHGS